MAVGIAIYSKAREFKAKVKAKAKKFGRKAKVKD